MKRLFSYNDHVDTNKPTALINIIFFQIEDGKIQCYTGHCSRNMPALKEHMSNQHKAYCFKEDFIALKEILSIPAKLRSRKIVGLVTSSKKAFQQLVSAFDGKPDSSFDSLYDDFISLGSTRKYNPSTKKYTDKLTRPSILAKIVVDGKTIRMWNDCASVDVSINQLFEFQSRATLHEEARRAHSSLYSVIKDQITTEDSPLTYELCKKCMNLKFEDELDVTSFAKLLADDMISYKEVMREMATKSSTFHRIFTQTMEFSIISEDGQFYVRYPDRMMRREKEFLLS